MFLLCEFIFLNLTFSVAYRLDPCSSNRLSLFVLWHTEFNFFQNCHSQSMARSLKLLVCATWPTMITIFAPSTLHEQCLIGSKIPRLLTMLGSSTMSCPPCSGTYHESHICHASWHIPISSQLFYLVNLLLQTCLCGLVLMLVDFRDQLCVASF